MDCPGRTNHHALAAELALRIINVCNIAFHGDGVMRTSLGTQATSDAGSLASLAGNRALVLVHA